tara:strand:- start:771 stop:1598 length:828 start_codon:yes stop_codon:yes gene_type:complete
LKLAITNIALPAFDHLGDFSVLRDEGFLGLEVALSRIWPEDWNTPSIAEVEVYRRAVNAAGLDIVGLHSLFWQREKLTMFGDAATIEDTKRFLVNLSAICRDLGGRTLIYGSRTARTRGESSIAEANLRAADFFAGLCQRIEPHGTCFCIEPLETAVADYVHSVLESAEVVRMVDHPAMRVQIDAKAMAAAEEISIETVRAVADLLVHVHANEMDLGPVRDPSEVAHAALGACLRDIGYDGYVSIEQVNRDPKNWQAEVARAAHIVSTAYSGAAS